MALTLVLGSLLAASDPAPGDASWTATEMPFVGYGGEVALDHGRPRVAYRNAEKRLSYASCDAQCDRASAWHSVDLDGPASWVHLAVDRSGRPHIAYLDDETRHGVFYATCAASCGDTSSWTRTRVDSTTDDEGLSLAVDPWGRPRLTYVRFPGSDLVFATCDVDCTSSAGWSAVTLPVGGGYPSLALDGPRPRIAYQVKSGVRGFELWYLTCDADCLNKRAWTSTTVTWFDAIGSPSLVVEGSGAHIAFNPNGAAGTSLAYASCESDCTVESRWSDPAMLTLGEVAMNPKLATTAGRPRILYTHCVNCLSAAEENHIYYASCESGCASSQRWSKQRLALGNDQALGYSLALDGERPRALSISGRSGARPTHVLSCDACGSPGTSPAPPSEPPPPSWGSPATAPSPEPGAPDGSGPTGGGANGSLGGHATAAGGNGASPSSTAGPGQPHASGIAGQGTGVSQADGSSASRRATSGGPARTRNPGGADAIGGDESPSESVRSLPGSVARLPVAAIDVITNPSRVLLWPWDRIALKGLAIALVALSARLTWGELHARRARLARLPSGRTSLSRCTGRGAG